MILTVEVMNHKTNKADLIAWEDVKAVYFSDDALNISMKKYGCFGIPREDIVSMPCFFANNKEAEKFYKDVDRVKKGEEIYAE